jgi:hypothetical protein
MQTAYAVMNKQTGQLFAIDVVKVKGRIRKVGNCSYG